MIKGVRQRWRAYRHRFTRALAGDLADPLARKQAHRHLMIADHGLLRKVWTNFYPVAPGVYRSNQPDPARVGVLFDMGLRSIVTLRGDARYSYLAFEEEACAEHGIALHRLHLNASKVDPPETYLRFLALMDEVEKPVLIHCKSGADRTGLAAALYLIDRGVAVPTARRQLALRFAHRRNKRYGSLDLLIDKYEADHAECGIAIRDWLRTRYDPVALMDEHRGAAR